MDHLRLFGSMLAHRLWLRLMTAVLLAFGLGLAGSIQAAPPTQVDPAPLWYHADAAALRAMPGGEQLIYPSRYWLVGVDLAALDAILATAPAESTHNRGDAEHVLTLPYPDGSLKSFAIHEIEMMEPELAARYPDIRNYRGQALDGSGALAVLDRTPQGFHGMILGPGGTVYIDPYRRGDVQHYLSYYKQDYQNYFGKQRDEIFPEQPLAEESESQGRPAPQQRGQAGEVMRIYRLAMAATGEYTQYHGGTVAQALAAINTTMNRVNGIYEREVAVRMILINNTDQLIFTNPTTDPYTNNSGFAMLSQNQTTVDNIIGSANYDIGHVLSTGGGGIAYFGVCNSEIKAGGVTGSNAPIGDPFDVDYVAHEIGHQYHANHTFNAESAGACDTGNREGSTAYEPGSGSTIMAYAGICNPQNLQNNSDDYFHSISFDEIYSFITDTSPRGGDQCAQKQNTGNTPPTANAGPDYTIPINTDFVLTGNASDAEGNNLTYNWEQFDLGAPWTSDALPNFDVGSGPIFRSYGPSTSPTRFFPDRANPLSANGESLPTTDRTLTFRFTVRDNNPNGGGVAFDTARVTSVSSAGPFALTAPLNNQLWTPGSSQTITWDVANTDVAPVSCSNVNIEFSTDGGNSYAVSLASNTPNDGSETVTIPATAATTSGKLRVICADNIFFAANNAQLQVCTPLLQDDHEDGFADWSTSNGIGNNSWEGRSSPSDSFSGSNHWFVANIDEVTDSYLDSQVLNAASSDLFLRFNHRYDMEAIGTNYYDGGVVEIKRNNGDWVDVGAANFTQNGYVGIMSDDYGSPLAGRQAFSGDSGGYIESVVDLPQIVAGDSFQIRFRQANDLFQAAQGWWVDDVLICTTSVTAPAEPSLAIGKTVSLSSDPLPRGGALTYTLTISNSGTGDAVGVRITDTLPAFVNGTNLDQTINVGAGTAVNLNIAATLANDAPFETPITNIAYLSYEDTQLQAAANFTTAADSGEPLLVLAKTVALSNDPLPRGGTLTYTLALSNVGTAAATGVRITDTLPAFIDGPDLDETVDVAVGQAITRTIIATLAEDAPFETPITNTVYLLFEDIRLQDTVSFVTAADLAAPGPLSFSKTVSGTAIAGSSNGVLTYTLRIRNTGETNVPNVYLTDTLPSELQFSRWLQQGSATLLLPEGRVLTWGPGSIPAQSDVVLRYTAQLSPGLVAGTSVENTAVISSPGQLLVDTAQVTILPPTMDSLVVDPTSIITQTLSTQDQILTITIPSGSLPNNAQRLVYTRLPAPSFPLPGQFGGLAFDLSLFDGNNQLITNPTFTPPLEIGLNYDPAALPPGLNADNLLVYTLIPNQTNGSVVIGTGSTVLGTWQAVPVLSRSPNLVIAVSHLTEFALSGPPHLYLPLVVK